METPEKREPIYQEPLIVPDEVADSIRKTNTADSQGEQDSQSPIIQKEEMIGTMRAKAEEMLESPGPQSAPKRPAKTLQDDDFEVVTPAQVADHIKRLIDKVQLVTLQKLEEIIPAITGMDDPEKLVNVVIKLADLKLSNEWTRELKDTIKKNPSLLSQTGRTPLLQKLQGFANRTKKAQAGDQREGQNKLKRAVGDGMDLPQD